LISMQIKLRIRAYLESITPMGKTTKKSMASRASASKTTIGTSNLSFLNAGSLRI